MFNFSNNKITELEDKIAQMETRITELEIRLSKALKNTPKAPAASSKKSNTSEEHIHAVMQKTHKTFEEVSSMMEEVRNRIGISYRDYDHYDFHLVAPEDQFAEYEKIQEKKARRKKKKANAERKKQKYLPVVMEATGWDRETAEAKMERAMEVAGSSYEHYAIYRFWELTEEEQKTYFTKRDAVLLRRKYNTNPEILKTLMNKDLCCKKLEAFLGRPWMSTENMNYDEFCKKFANEKKIIYKPRASSGGHGIQIIEMNSGSLEDIYNKINAMPSGIVEGYLIQHPEMKKLSLNSVNTIRIVTICTNKFVPGVERNKVHFLYAGVRMGQGGNFVDNLHSGGMMAAVDVNTGIVVTGGVDHTNAVHEVHPDTGTQIVGFQLPYFEEAKRMLEKASEGMPGYFGWDVAITENGPVIVEVNTSPGADGLQTPYVPQKKGMRHVIEKYL